VAQMKVEVGFTEKEGYLRYLNVSFRHLRKDWINFDVIVYLNVLGIDYIRDWINKAIESAIKSMMHLPHKFEMNFETPVVSPLKKLKEGKYDNDAIYEGAVTVTLKKVRNLKSTDLLPLQKLEDNLCCSLKVGQFWLTSRKSIKNEWNEQFLLPFDTRLTDEEKILHLVIGTKDLKGKHNFGEIAIPVNSLQANTLVENWFSLKGKHAKGEVLVELEYDSSFRHGS